MRTPRSALRTPHLIKFFPSQPGLSLSPRPTLALTTPPRLGVVTLAALGVVYGDIGTSPLYAVKECFFGPHRVPINEANVLGILSLIFWALVVVVTIKYHIYVIRADNRGEGGILALMALVRGVVTSASGQWLVVGLGVFGGSLLYADGIITPAISVLGALEGLAVATPALSRYIVPLAAATIAGLFLLQRRGTAGVGAMFGPVMIVWFAVIAVLGVAGILMEPSVLKAVNPWHAVRFFGENRFAGFLVLGSVFLVITGGEALYADLGHFGHLPIQINWFGLVGPALLLNYFGQGALVLSNPEAADNPFFRLAPDWALYPLLVLAIMAAVIASQAVISGAFSLTRQAVQLGYLPRANIVHTSETEIGQIYIPGVNWGLMVATLVLVFGFRSSSGLANAYGVALTTTMVITTVLAHLVARRLWGWKWWQSLAVTGVFLLIDLAFFGASIIKVAQGGWFPLAIAATIYAVMTTWKAGRRLLADRLRAGGMPLDLFLGNIDTSGRVPGVAVFMTQEPEGVPVTLLHNLKHNKVLHERVVLLTIMGEEIPYVRSAERLKVQDLGKGFYRIIGRYGFMEDPNVPELLERAKAAGDGLEFKPLETTYFLGRETLIPSQKPGMARWRTRLFGFMSRNAHRATSYFRIPPNRVVELGAQVEL